MPPLSMIDIQSVRFRLVYGYVGEIKFIEGEPEDEISFDPPAMIAIVVKLWWRYGSARADQNDGWAFCWILPFRILFPF